MNLLEILKMYQEELRSRGRDSARAVLSSLGVRVYLQRNIDACFDEEGNPISDVGTVTEYVFEVVTK
jgi:hypothetical protein